jgi:hypothetical protein
MLTRDLIGPEARTMTALCLGGRYRSLEAHDFSSLVGQVLAADLVWRGCAKSRP